MSNPHRDVHSSLLVAPAGGDCFDRWRDYMDLARVLQSMRLSNRMERKDEDAPKRVTSPSPPSCRCSPIRAPSPTLPSTLPPPSWYHTNNSQGTGSSSNLSDHSYRDTSFSYCRFCKHNRESPDVYLSHRLKTKNGKVICPVLRMYTCSICGASGDNAHTRRYCPQKQRRETEPSKSVFSVW